MAKAVLVISNSSTRFGTETKTNQQLQLKSITSIMDRVNLRINGETPLVSGDSYTERDGIPRSNW